jgi:N-acetylmuramoyl-L-alanine amidase-like protein/putative peptidoglycan binding protein
MAINRRALLSSGLTVTAIGVTGIATPQAIAATAGLTPKAAVDIATTDDWGARPPSGTIQVLDSKPIKILVHHTATPNSTDLSQDHAFELSRSIQDHHMDNNGWIDTGQHFTNSRGGWLTEGRHRSLEALRGGTQQVVSAHATGQNSISLGIENEGLYTDVDVPTQLWTSLVALCRYMCDQYGIDPDEIYGHRDYNNTECPGDVLYARLPELRTAVGGAAFQRPTWPLLRPGDTGPRVSAGQHLLRSHGLTGVPTDGVFGPSTTDAVRRFASAAGVAAEHCYASAHADESGLLGAGTWPLLVRTVRADEPGDAGAAARVLLAARAAALGAPAARGEVIDTNGWRQLLA